MLSNTKIVAIGDISFRGAREDLPSIDIFGQVTSLFRSSDLVIANLESPLVDSGTPVPGKCTLRGTTDWANVIKDAGIGFVSLANNHMMDYGVEGLKSTIKACKEAGLYYAGAGENIQEACEPVYINVKGNRIAILCRTSVIVSSPSYATDKDPGVAFLESNETIDTISACTKKADFVILIIHWGIEDYLYPSKEQRQLANQFVEAGANLIIGHHPHVLQGIERIGKAFVVYSLGNFIFDEFEWSFINDDGVPQTSMSVLSEINRRSGIVQLTLVDGQVNHYDIQPTLIDRDGIVILDENKVGRKTMHRLSSRLRWPFYNQFWLAYSLKQEWILRINPLFAGKFTLEKMTKLRFSHVRQFMKKLIQSGRISLGKTTNPYD
jgi:hypothetical protein